MKNLTKILLSIYVAIMMIAVACKKDDPTPTPPVTTPTTTPPVVKSTAKELSKFSFAALSPVVDATIDASTKAITATVPAGTDVTKLVPTITISDKATVSPATGVAQDFSKEVSYTVTAEDGGTVVWKVNVTKEVLVVPTSTDFIYRGQSSSKILLKAFDATTGKEVWAFTPNTASNTDAYTDPYISDGIVYIAGGDKNMYAIDAKTGVKIWVFPVLTTRSNPVSANGVLYFSGLDDKFYALDAKSGIKKWTFDLYHTNTSPVVINGIVYITTTKGGKSAVEALDATNGSLKWEKIGDVADENVCVSNGLVYVKNGDFGITALDAITGTIKWKTGDSKTSPNGGYQTIMSDILYTATYTTGSIMAIDAKNGVTKWNTQLDPKGGTANSSPIVADGIIYMVSGDNKLYAVDAVTGVIKWSVSEFGPYNSPIVANGIVYGSYSSLVGIDASTGVSKFKLPSISGNGNLALWINGKVYLPSTSGSVQ